MTRVTDRNDWFEIWFEDKQSIIETMVRNMTADLDNGYNYFGNTITKQRKMIEEYKEKFDGEMKCFWMMDEKQVNKWCYYDLKRRGAID